MKRFLSVIFLSISFAAGLFAEELTFYTGDKINFTIKEKDIPKEYIITGICQNTDSYILELQSDYSNFQKIQIKPGMKFYSYSNIYVNEQELIDKDNTSCVYEIRFLKFKTIESNKFSAVVTDTKKLHYNYNLNTQQESYSYVDF